MKISIVGTGYVGLVTGACFADRGHEVTCIDLLESRVAVLNSGKSPIFEPGLDELLGRTVGARLSATTDLAQAVSGTELTFIAVGTPFDGTEIDLSFVLEASRQIGEALAKKTDYHLVVVKSTVVPGTTEDKVVPVLETSSGKRAGADFGVGMNPEFLSEGEAVRDFLYPDRIVLGGIDDRSIELLAQAYEPFPDCPQLRVNPRTAEMIKYASNALLALLISYSNEIANLGSAIGRIDSKEVMRGIHLSQYFALPSEAELPSITSFLAAGCGFGGSCLPKDVSALIAYGQQNGEPMPVLRAVMETNRRQPARVVERLRRRLPKLEGQRIALLGLAFKPNTSDVRESPAFPIIEMLIEAGCFVAAYDPEAMEEARKVCQNNRLSYATSLEVALDGVGAVVVVTPWQNFRKVPELLAKRDPLPLFIDCRRAFAKDCLSNYDSMGL